jgi:hypothetical protein
LSRTLLVWLRSSILARKENTMRDWTQPRKYFLALLVSYLLVIVCGALFIAELADAALC